MHLKRRPVGVAFQYELIEVCSTRAFPDVALADPDRGEGHPVWEIAS
jgi:hypothetical protein